MPEHDDERPGAVPDRSERALRRAHSTRREHAQKQIDKDRSYSPGSERETRDRQDGQARERHPSVESVPAGVRQKPGAGGPDDTGEIEVDDDLDPAKIAERGHLETDERP